MSISSSTTTFTTYYYFFFLLFSFCFFFFVVFSFVALLQRFASLYTFVAWLPKEQSAMRSDAGCHPAEMHQAHKRAFGLLF